MALRSLHLTLTARTEDRCLLEAVALQGALLGPGSFLALSQAPLRILSAEGRLPQQVCSRCLVSLLPKICLYSADRLSVITAFWIPPPALLQLEGPVHPPAARCHRRAPCVFMAQRHTQNDTEQVEVVAWGLSHC